MSMLSEQLSAVFAAPIPFAIALVPLGVAMWGAFEWSYRSVLNKRKELFELSRSEVGYWKDHAERTAKAATQQLGQLDELISKQLDITAGTTKQVKELTADLREEARNQVGHLTATIKQLDGQLNALGQANTSTAAFPMVSSGPMDWTSSGWQPRNPKITGRSG
jgi:hypothetical protein